MTGPAGRRPPPMKIVWAMLRNVNALFNIQKRTSRGPGPAVDESNMQHDIELEATSKVALAAIEVGTLSMRAEKHDTSVDDHNFPVQELGV
jgi:hypothetical protein